MALAKEESTRLVKRQIFGSTTGYHASTPLYDARHTRTDRAR